MAAFDRRPLRTQADPPDDRWSTLTCARPRLDTGGMSGSSLGRQCRASPTASTIAHGPHVECTECCAHGASTIRARRHVPYRRRCLRVHPCTHVRGRVRVRVCACAHSCARARGPQRNGALYKREGALSTHQYALACGVRVPSDRIACGRAGSLGAWPPEGTHGPHCARVPAVPREYWVSTAGGAAVKTTYGLIATDECRTRTRSPMHVCVRWCRAGGCHARHRRRRAALSRGKGHSARAATSRMV
jgi:hypothetical protein